MCGELNNQVLVEKICYDLGYNLENFISDSTFAFFYEIRQKDENIGFIYQGNNHPFIHVMSMMLISEEGQNLLNLQCPPILDFCKNRGSHYSVENDDGEPKLVLTISIPEEEFTAEKFVESLESIVSCLNNVSLFLKKLKN